MFLGNDVTLSRIGGSNEVSEIKNLLAQIILTSPVLFEPAQVSLYWPRKKV